MSDPPVFHPPRRALRRSSAARLHGTLTIGKLFQSPEVDLSESGFSVEGSIEFIFSGCLCFFCSSVFGSIAFVVSDFVVRNFHEGCTCFVWSPLLA